MSRSRSGGATKPASRPKRNSPPSWTGGKIGKPSHAGDLEPGRHLEALAVLAGQHAVGGRVVLERLRLGVHVQQLADAELLLVEDHARGAQVLLGPAERLLH